MDLFLAYLTKLLQIHGIELRVEVASEPGGLVLVAPGSRLSLADGAAEGDEAEIALLTPLLPRLRRALAVCSAWPMEHEGPHGRIVATISPPEGPNYSVDLNAVVTLTRDGAPPVSRTLALAQQYLLDSDEPTFVRRLALWREQCRVALEASAATPLDFALDPPGDHEQPDPRWEAFAADLGLEPEAVSARVASALAWAEQRLAQVEPRYREIYGLPLPPDLADLAALIDALGALPQPSFRSYAPSAPGWQRGNGWLDASLSMRAGGILDWFAPDGLDRPTLDAAVMYGDALPAGVEGPLDPRLDVRFRCDAPQLVSFAWGDSDGLHWGLWYDSPEHDPRIAHNYARDSAETWCDRQDARVLAFLASKCEERLRELREELARPSDYWHYSLSALRAVRVVTLHVEALRAQVGERRAGVLPPCPWPRTESNPIGSPQLALPLDSGTFDPAAPGFGMFRGRPTEAELRRGITLARRELTRGRAASAYGLGLYLHWHDMDALREEAASLLRDAYLALGWAPFADILDVHVKHRDLRSVGVFGAASWPPPLPGPEQIRAAPEAVAVAWDWVSSRAAGEAPDRFVAYARARRLGLDWDEPVSRAVATWGADEAHLQRLLSGGA